MVLVTYGADKEIRWGGLGNPRNPFKVQSIIRINRYMNNVSGHSTDEAPPDFRVGLLADDMGLGKTLSMICLIAANQAYPGLSLPRVTPGPLNSVQPAVMKTTLLIVPPACMYEHSS